MYLIGIRDGIHPCGNNGTLKSHYKAEYKVREQAQRFSDMHSLDEVYRLDFYPQELCELSPANFVEHVRVNCKRYI